MHSGLILGCWINWRISEQERGRATTKKWDRNRRNGKETKMGVRENEVWPDYVKNLAEGQEEQNPGY